MQRSDGPAVRRGRCRAAVGIAVLAAGCASTYVAPPGQTTAPITVARGQSPALMWHGASFTAYTDTQCRSRLGLLGVVNALTPDGKTTRLPVGTPVVLRAHSEGQELGGSTRWRCVNVARLALEPGYRYEVQQNFSQGRCSLNAVRLSDNAPGSVPPGAWALEQLPVEGACKAT